MAMDRRFNSRAIVRLMGVAVCLTLTLGFASREAAAGRVRVKLGKVKGVRSEEVRVPLRLKAGRRTLVGAVGTTIRFDPKQLEFVSARPGRGLARRGGEVVAAARVVSETEAVLRVGAMTRQPAHFGRPLRNGVVAWLTFRVQPGARGRRVVLTHEPEAASAGVPAVRVETRQGRPRRIRIGAP